MPLLSPTVPALQVLCVFDHLLAFGEFHVRLLPISPLSVSRMPCVAAYAQVNDCGSAEKPCFIKVVASHASALHRNTSYSRPTWFTPGRCSWRSRDYSVCSA